MNPFNMLSSKTVNNCSLMHYELFCYFFLQSLAYFTINKHQTLSINTESFEWGIFGYYLATFVAISIVRFRNLND